MLQILERIYPSRQVVSGDGYHYMYTEHAEKGFSARNITVSQDRFHCILTSDCLNQERDKIRLG